MAHCPYEKLQDLSMVFERIRACFGLRESKPGVFYFKTKPFLHFHIKNCDRWAHVRSDGDWERIDVPLHISDSALLAFTKRIVEHCERLKSTH